MLSCDLFTKQRIKLTSRQQQQQQQNTFNSSQSKKWFIAMFRIKDNNSRGAGYPRSKILGYRGAAKGLKS